MPIYEYYCPDNHKIYQFYAKTLARGQTVPKCPENPGFRMLKLVSPFSVTGRSDKSGKPKQDAGKAGVGAEDPPPGGAAEDAKMEAAMSAMESEFSSVDENDPRAMGRMMRRMSELTGEKLDGEMEEVVRKLEEGADPDDLEEQMGGAFGEGEGDGMDDPYGMGGGEPKPLTDPKEPKHRFRVRRGSPVRDPKLYDYE